MQKSPLIKYFRDSLGFTSFWFLVNRQVVWKTFDEFYLQSNVNLLLFMFLVCTFFISFFNMPFMILKYYKINRFFFVLSIMMVINSFIVSFFDLFWAYILNEDNFEPLWKSYCQYFDLLMEIDNYCVSFYPISFILLISFDLKNWFAERNKQ